MRRPYASRLALLPLVLALAGCAISPGERLQPDPAFATVEVAGLGFDPRTQSPVVLLRDPTSEGVMPIWIGIAEGEAIARVLQGVAVPRPMTHDLLANLIRSLGAEVVEVRIHEQREGTYYGVIRLSNGTRGERVEIDSRPSDGLALALRTGAPIRVARELLRDSFDSYEEAPRPRTAPTV